jgi:RimJ/RimL family protein N-acetyltransferase
MPAHHVGFYGAGMRPDTDHPQPSGTPTPALKGTLTTDRLVIRPGTNSDARATWGYRRLATVNEWLTGSPESLEVYEDTFRDAARLANTVIIETRPDLGGHVIGDFMIRIEDAWAQTDVAAQAERRQVELGWVLDPAHTGRGFATEAVTAIIAYCFETIHAHRVVANCFLANESSWRLMERVGMRRELHAVRDALHRSGRWLDSVGYAILSDERPTT